MKDLSVKKRPTKMASSAARREREQCQHEQNYKTWLASDKFTSLEDLNEKLSKDLSSDFKVLLDKNSANGVQYLKVLLDKNSANGVQYLTIFTVASQQNVMPSMENVLKIIEDATFEMYKCGCKIAKSKLRYIIHDHKNRFTLVSQVLNVIGFLKNYQLDSHDEMKKVKVLLEEVDMENISEKDRQLLSFIKMQLDLSQKYPNNRRYSNDFLIKCAILYRSSPRMYHLLKEEMGFIVPDESTVQRVTRIAAYKGGIDAETRATFKAFAENLTEREKILHLGIDEVHTLNTLQLLGSDLGSDLAAWQWSRL